MDTDQALAELDSMEQCYEIVCQILIVYACISEHLADEHDHGNSGTEDELTGVTQEMVQMQSMMSASPAPQLLVARMQVSLESNKAEAHPGDLQVLRKNDNKLFTSNMSTMVGR